MAYTDFKKIGRDFWSNDRHSIRIKRSTVRAFVYHYVYLDAKIKNISNENINFVMRKFNLKLSDRSKIKKIIYSIIHRNNDELLPIFDSFFDDDENCNTPRNLKAIC